MDGHGWWLPRGPGGMDNQNQPPGTTEAGVESHRHPCTLCAGPSPKPTAEAPPTSPAWCEDPEGRVVREVSTPHSEERRV